MVLFWMNVKNKGTLIKTQECSFIITNVRMLLF